MFAWGVARKRLASFYPLSSFAKASPRSFHAVARLADKGFVDPAASYKERLEKKARELGFESAEALLEDKRLKEKEALLARYKEAEKKALAAKEAAKAKDGKMAAGSKAEAVEGSALEQFMKVEKVRGETPENVRALWQAYHAKKVNSVCAVLTADQYSILRLNLKTFPLFILPVPHEEGAEFMLMQFSGDDVFFTSLSEYQVKQDKAEVLASVSHYSDLAESHDLVLMNGTVTEAGAKRGLKSEDLQLLSLLLQSFYLTGGPAKWAFVEKFHREPQSFDYQAFLEEAQKP